MAFNVWSPQGQLVGLTTQCNPSVIYEGSPQILAGPNVFKLWSGTNNGTTGINYYESADGLTGWTPHPSNPVLNGASITFPTVYHVGSTYYIYYSGYPPAATTAIKVRTSANGITWGSATDAIPLGASGAWDDTAVAQINLVPPFSGPTYYGYYFGLKVTGGLGLATSTDLINWTKSPSNPILAQFAPATFQYVNGTYYLWAPDGGVSNASGALGYNGVVRMSSPTASGPWSYLLFGGSGNLNRILVNYPTLAADVTPSNAPTTQLSSIGDPYMVSALGNLYMYWTKTTIGGFQMGINASIATGYSPAQLVATYEGVQGFPIPGQTLNLSTLASDTFVRANANPMGGNWTPIGTSGGFAANQIVSNLVEPTVLGSNCESFYNAVSFPDDHWSQITVKNATGAAAGQVGPSVRMSTGSNEYRMGWLSNTVLGAVGTLTILPVIAGAGGTSSHITMTVSLNDVLMLAVSGQNLLGYLNGYPTLALATSGLATGSAGFTEFASGAVTNAQLNAWSGGGFVAAPNAPSIGGSSGYSIGSSNRCCSHGLTSQAIF